jgi:hypothetical protein
LDSESRCFCVFPQPTEEELMTVPGAEPGTAIRVFAQSGADGYVRLQQLAYSDGVGWYVQKSFVIPGEALGLLIPQLRKADCLIPARPQPMNDNPLKFPRLGDDHDLPGALRREA